MGKKVMNKKASQSTAKGKASQSNGKGACFYWEEADFKKKAQQRSLGYNLTPVMQVALLKSPYKLIYPPMEKIPAIVVENFPMLGKLTALKFLEWVQQNPDGVISLPTGKTPEHFIRWVQYYLAEWNSPNIQKDLESHGVNPGIKPEMRGLHFVQIDEFYPISPQQHNSFYYYVNKYYIKGFGLDPEKALLIDPSRIGVPEKMTLREVFPDDHVDLELRTKRPKNHLEEVQKYVIHGVDEFCMEYEQKIRKLGGIGFFLGGIGPDGHIGFNVEGSDHYSTTRLTPINYETQAAAAGDLGGIEIARNKLVITIGLKTICYNPDVVSIIIAAGQSKAKVVSEAVQSEKNIHYPATALQGLKNARFFITKGAAYTLVEREFEIFQNTPALSAEQVDEVLMNISWETQKPFVQLTELDLQNDRLGSILLKKAKTPLQTILKEAEERLKKKIYRGLQEVDNKTFLHTAPHHDDIMLGYLPYLIRIFRNSGNYHHFSYMTSGFTAVTNSYMCLLLKALLHYIEKNTFSHLAQNHYFDELNEYARDTEVALYLDGVASNNEEIQIRAACRRLLRNLMVIFEEDNIYNIRYRIEELINYFQTQYPGRKDLTHIQQIKGRLREWEADILWRYFGFNHTNVSHLRLGFYKGDVFTESPTIERDAKPILELLEKLQPHYLTVAFDPEGAGPDTHYKVLQAIYEALMMYKENHDISNMQILGYRNVWFRFAPYETNCIVPVSMNRLSTMNHSFLTSFGSQKEASFPSHEYDGPFSGLAQKIQVEQYNKVKTFLGEKFFVDNSNRTLRAAVGMLFLKTMNFDEFSQHSQHLKKTLEESRTTQNVQV